jgi:hypothetical protein
MVARDLYDAVQPPAQAKWASVCGALQVTADRWSDAGLSANGMRLCASESGAGQAAGNAGATAKIPLEQLPKLFAKQAKTRTMVALRSPAWRARPNKRESLIPVGVCSENGATSCRAKRSKSGADSSRLVLWSGGFYRAVARSHTRLGKRASSRSRTE